MNHRIPVKLNGANASQQGNCELTYHLKCLHDYITKESRRYKNMQTRDVPYIVYCKYCRTQPNCKPLTNADIINAYRCFPTEYIRGLEQQFGYEPFKPDEELPLHPEKAMSWSCPNCSADVNQELDECDICGEPKPSEDGEDNNNEMI